jgi:hypothetical protein
MTGPFRVEIKITTEGVDEVLQHPEARMWWARSRMSAGPHPGPGARHQPAEPCLPHGDSVVMRLLWRRVGMTMGNSLLGKEHEAALAKASQHY